MRLKNTFILLLILCVFSLNAQILDISPAFPTQNDVVTIIYDASEGNGALLGTTPVYGHMGLITTASTSSTDWKHVQGNWGTADPNTLMTDLGNNKHQITVDISNFYGFPNGTTVEQLSFVFRNTDGSIVGRATDGSDIYYDVYPANAGFLAKFFKPYNNPQIGTIGQSIEIKAASNNSATLELYDNGVFVTSVSNATTLNHNLNITTQGLHLVELVANDGSTTVRDTFHYTGNPTITVQDAPTGLDYGANYINDSTVILKFFAPNKNFVYVLGDFNNWAPIPDYYMNKGTDNETWWIELTSLTPDQRYGYQYWVDGEIKIADPYSALILDPNSDGGIDATTYPNPHPYPVGQNGFVTVLHPGKPVYNWQTTNFTAPEETDLVIYELLVRDFVSAHNYETLIDSLDYLSNLGINAIELMPPGEFENNESWGYNPSFHMALDKYYGTPEKFKEFVDECHSRGIAVIIDMVFNHAYGQNPLVNLYWDATSNAPATNSPYFNADCPHPPYCWGYDFDHESTAVQYYMDRINKYWLEEYKVDGFRFDYTKGFTNAGDVSFNQNRIDLLKRMADEIWAVNSDAYVILEHWADNNEETQLANYGMMVWANVTHGYADAVKGFGGNVGGNGIYKDRGWAVPHVISYMESHDEERAMYAALTEGKTTSSWHNVRDTAVALRRMALASTFFYPIPGPKMIWQFQEVGYDVSIDNPCRICNKPILWNYFQEVNRQRLYDINAALINLRLSHDVFRTTDFNYTLTGTVKRIRLNDPTMNVVILGNFDVINRDINPAFQHTGMWYEFFTGDSLNVTQTSAQINLQAGEYRLYTDQPLNTPSVTNTSVFKTETLNATIYPNPTQGFVYVEFTLESNTDVTMRIVNLNGQVVKNVSAGKMRTGEQRFQIDIQDLPYGNYILQVQTTDSQVSLPIIKF